MTISDRPDDGADIARLRAALIEMGRMIPGCALRDTVSTDFLMLLPEEMRQWKAGLTPANTAQVAPDGRAEGPSFMSDRTWPDCLDPNAPHNRRHRRRGDEQVFDGWSRDEYKAMAAFENGLDAASPVQVASAPDRAGVILLSDALAVVDRMTPRPAGGAFSHTNSMRVIASDIRQGLAALSATPSREGEVS